MRSSTRHGPARWWVPLLALFVVAACAAPREPASSAAAKPSGAGFLFLCRNLAPRIGDWAHGPAPMGPP